MNIGCIRKLCSETSLLKDPLRFGRVARFVALTLLLAGALTYNLGGSVPSQKLKGSSVPQSESTSGIGSSGATDSGLLNSEVPERPRRITLRQSLPTEADGQWAEVEGEVSFVSEQAQALVLELSSGTTHMRVEVAHSANVLPFFLLHSRIRAVGRIRLTMTHDGDFLAGTLLVPAAERLEVLDWAPARWLEHPVRSVGSLPRTNAPAARDRIVRLRGKVAALKAGRAFDLKDETGQIRIEPIQAPPSGLGIEVEVVGRWGRGLGTNIVLRGGGYREIAPREQASAVLPQLTRAEQIKSLSATEAQRGYPVRIRGIVTSVLRNGFIIQDATWAVYVFCVAAPDRLRPTVSEYWEVEGVTREGFAPSITPARMTRIASGSMPEPLHPTWDQLINGSLDAQYVEVQGIVTWVQGNEMSLLTRSGKISIRLVETLPSLKSYEGALISIRGCVIPDRDDNTQQVHLGRIELSNYLISTEEPAPADPFAAPVRRVSELLRFNSHASAIERVRTSGQVVHVRRGEFYLTDGTNGLRFIPKVAMSLPIGERVEVVGFPGLSGPSPVLRHAVVRRLGFAALPPAKTLSTKSLLSRRHDATLVRVQARLVGLSMHRSELVLELRADSYSFLARLVGRPQQELVPDSLLEVAGVYAGQGGDFASGRDIDTFELLLNSPQGITVLEQPSWWTLQRALWVLGGTGLLSIISLAWVATLKREVHRQTDVIQHKVEREAVLEERTRIAREFHDTIEQQVAAVTLQLQAARVRLDSSPEFVRHVLQLAESMLRHAQSEARHSVWNLRAQTLQNSSLEDAVRTVANYARNGAEVETEVAVEGEARPIPGRIENHLLRISQEAIANAVKHGAAKTVRLRLRYAADSVQLSIRDDGKGFVTEAAPSGASGHFGLLGMRERAEKIGGSLSVISAPGQGTEIIFKAPLPQSKLETPSSP